LSNWKLVWLSILWMGQMVYAQEPARHADYVLGTEEKLEMDVHIWGQVKMPGEYRVAYNTNVLELISKAGGPTSFANLKKVRLARPIRTEQSGVHDQTKSTRIVEYNLNRYLSDRKDTDQVPVLQPGDVVFIVQNRWFQWRELVRVANEVAVIASVYVWYMRAK
jgi:protein involved in polysaccharide export with SLBB domain